MRKLLLALLLISSPVLMRADFTYMESTQVTGGSMAAMMQSLGPLAATAAAPIVTTHVLKGNRMATIMRDTITIVDLDKETSTTIDNARKQFSVMTFAQMLGLQKGSNGQDVQTNFKASAKATGKTRTIQGLVAQEMVIATTIQGADPSTGQTGAMNFVTEMWVAPLPGYVEVREFNKKLVAKMGVAFGSMPQLAQANMGPAGMGQASMGKAMEAVAEEMQKLDGIPVLSTSKMGGAGGGGASVPSSSGAGACSADSPSQAPQGSKSAADALAGAFGGFGNGKKADRAATAQAQPDCAPAPAGGGSASRSFMETTTTLTSYSAAPVDALKFEIPAGFKQVDNRGR